mgnify:CR=1 FL=1
MKKTREIPRWLEDPAPVGDVAISSRVRLARNLEGYCFPHKLSRDDRDSVINNFRNAILSNPFFQDYQWRDLSELSPLERLIMQEEHLISPAFLTMSGSGRGLAYNSGRTESLMINEEDHLRLQIIAGGLDLKRTWERANETDDELEKSLNYAFSTDFGYKTACPTNMGTGLRASVMLHLCALFTTGNAGNLAEYASGFGLTIRGIFGEGTGASGHLFQISNQFGITNTEDETISKLERFAREVIDRERNAREMLVFERKNITEDRIFRDLAVLKSARLLNINEFMERFSYFRMGVETGILPPMSRSTLNKILIFSRPAYICYLYGLDENIEKQDKARAALLREMLQDYNA